MSRPRHWALLLLVLGFVAVYCVSWAGYVDRRAQPHYRQAPPGASATFDGVSVRVIAFRYVDTVDTGFNDAEPPAPGTRWVEAQVQIDLGAAEPPVDDCQFDLLGADGRLWSPEDVGDPDDGIARDCDAEEPLRNPIHLTYAVPESQLSGLYGLVIRPSSDNIWKFSTVVRP